LNLLKKGQKPRLFFDEIRSPVLAEDVAQAVAELVDMEDPPSLLHLGGPEALSRYEIGKNLALAFGYGLDRLESISLSSIDPVAPRPPDLSLDTALLKKTLKHPPRSFQAGIAFIANPQL
ncbi:MAG: sugar nucleotide-binding protein, partial [Planctomycetes bacterium]|nr:sugar nucleotide-binding protein [Planctomycetota bacterium]